MFKRGCVLLWCVLMLLAMTGCAAIGGDMNAQLRPPKASGEQGEIEQALASYVAAMSSQENYVLQYPRSGDHRSAFLIQDMDGDGHNEAVVFYRLGAEGAMHVNLLRQSGGEWVSMHDHEGTTADIHSVCFGDMDGDGVEELFISWDMYSSRTYQLSMYTLAGNRIFEKFTASCAMLTVADLTADGRDDCLLLNVDAESLTAALWSMNDGVMEEIGRGVVDGYVQRLVRAQVASLTDMQNGVFVDCVKSSENYATQVIYWRAGRLVVPLYDAAMSGNFETVRPLDIPSGDIDEDGRWEWPICTLFAGHADDTAPHESTDWFTEFWRWDPDVGETVKSFSSIYNREDGYYLLVDDHFYEQYTTTYDRESRTLWVYTLSQGQAGNEVFAVRTRAAQDEIPEDTTYQFEKIAESRTLEYEVWYDRNNTLTFNMETLRYMLTLL